MQFACRKIYLYKKNPFLACLENFEDFVFFGGGLMGARMSFEKHLLEKAWNNYELVVTPSVLKKYVI